MTAKRRSVEAPKIFIVHKPAVRYLLPGLFAHPISIVSQPPSLSKLQTAGDTPDSATRQLLDQVRACVWS
jgi:hypothetical protein